MRVLVLTRHSREGSSSRLRFAQYEDYLRSAGIEIEIAPLLRSEYLYRFNAGKRRHWGQIAVDYFSRATKLFGAGRYDLLWIEKELFPDLPAWCESVLRQSGISYAVDFDDAVFHNYDLARGMRRLLSKKIDRVMRGARLVTCGNAYLAARATRAGAPWAEVIPTVIDLDRYLVKVGSATVQPLRIVWIGSPSTARYLDLIKAPLATLSARFSFQLRVIGAQGVAFTGIEVDCRRWSEDTEAELLRECDIGIMPLPDSPWERGKCGYKLIQYMACGLPVVGSGVGVNAEVIAHGKSGFVADSLDTWVEYLGQLLADPGLRVRMGAAGRRRVEETYCVQRQAPRLVELLRLAARPSGAH